MLEMMNFTTYGLKRNTGFNGFFCPFEHETRLDQIDLVLKFGRMPPFHPACTIIILVMDSLSQICCQYNMQSFL